MATITKGYTFESTEVVTAAKLHALIDGAELSGIGVDDFGESVHGIYAASPASEAPGDIHFYHEAVNQWELPATGDAWATSYYGLRVDASWINVFNPYGLETPKFVQGTDVANLIPGRAVLAEQNDTAATLRTAEDNTTNVKPNTFGCSAAVTYPTDAPVRTILIGPCIAELSSSSTDFPWPTLMYDLNAPAWTISGATSISGASGMKLSNVTSGTGLQLGYMFGGEVFRN